MDETVERCRELIEQDGVARQVSVNAAKLVALRDDDRLRQIIARCDIVNADGQSVVWASRMLGDPLPERVAGIDLMERLLLLAERHAYRVFFLGATPRVLERAVRKIRARHPQLRVAGYHDGYFRADDEDAVRAEISAATPDILFVAMSSPGKEYWLDSADGLDARLVMGVGGALDVLAGDVRRAPGWIQRLGLEWLYRLAQEPGRLWRRYLTTNARFLLLLAREEIGRARGIARMQ
jgi:N-acetylglucosaminyldiphosphoundecaprenol N-acetyl-beta-D-mannosaminyltransferase